MDESHLIAAVRHVSLNPVRAHLVRKADDWTWSSVRAHLAREDDELVSVAPVLRVPARINAKRALVGWVERFAKPITLRARRRWGFHRNYAS